MRQQNSAICALQSALPVLSGRRVITALALCASVAGGAPAQALDKGKVSSSKTSITITVEITPKEALRKGARAYYAGDKASAIDPLSYAASKGQPMAAWKLGQMYASGDGVQEDNYKAFKYFSQVVQSYSQDNPRGPSAPFVADSLVALGSYYLTGINDTDIAINRFRAREIFTYAASYFGDADAQYLLGKIYFEGEEDERDIRQAARWLKLSASKGHIGAQAKFGELLYFSLNTPQARLMGLQWLTLARRQANYPHLDWVGRLHEKAFALATEHERRLAAEWADLWIAKRQPQLATSE